MEKTELKSLIESKGGKWKQPEQVTVTLKVDDFKKIDLKASAKLTDALAKVIEATIKKSGFKLDHKWGCGEAGDSNFVWEFALKQ